MHIVCSKSTAVHTYNVTTAPNPIQTGYMTHITVGTGSVYSNIFHLQLRSDIPILSDTRFAPSRTHCTLSQKGTVSVSVFNICVHFILHLKKSQVVVFSTYIASQKCQAFMLSNHIQISHKLM